jgi:hypothetical protein
MALHPTVHPGVPLTPPARVSDACGATPDPFDALRALREVLDTWEIARSMPPTVQTALMLPMIRRGRDVLIAMEAQS